jgi:hypothetical protein
MCARRARTREPGRGGDDQDRGDGDPLLRPFLRSTGALAPAKSAHLGDPRSPKRTLVIEVRNMLAMEGCGRTARVVGMTNASHPTVTEGTQRQ